MLKRWRIYLGVGAGAPTARGGRL